MTLAMPTANSAATEIRLLGGFQLLQGGRPCRFKAPAKAESLLGYLISHRVQPSSREFLTSILWPDDTGDRGRANLRRHVLLLQRALPQDASRDWIAADKRSIWWNTQCDCRVDIIAFEALSADAGTALRASELYAGDFLPDVYDDWVLPVRERLHRLQSVNLERLVAAYRRNRDFTNAISAAESLLLHDPWREDAVRTLMSLHHESGDRAGALREYERFAARLRAEMSVDPMPETQARFEEIVRNSLTLGNAAEVPEPSSPPPAQRTMPFVGRETELGTLREWWDRALRGHGRFALIGGEAGVGKSRLIAEFGSVVESQGGRIVGGATTFPEARPYQAVIESLQNALPLISALEISPVWLAAACAVLPELRDVHSALPSLPGLEGEQQQTRLFEALASCFEGIARARPLLIVLEDLHWAGSGTAAFLEYLSRRIVRHPMLVIATHRDDETEPWHPVRALRRTLRRSSGFASLPLARLSKADVGRFVAAIPRFAQRTAAFSDRVHAISDGNPFFLGEIARESLASSSDEPALPQSVADVVRARIGRLSESAQTLAHFAAVAGHAFDVELLAGAAGVGEDRALAALDELLDLRLIREAHGAEGAASYDFSFSHDLIRAEIYGAMTKATRARRHRRIGLVMERLHAGSIEVARDLARHFDEGLDARRATRYYHACAERALGLYADGEAVACLSRALELVADARLRYELLTMRESIYARSGKRQEQAADLESLAGIAAQSGDAAETGEALRRRAAYAAAMDDRDSQQGAISELRRHAAQHASALWEAVADESSASLCVSMARYDDARSYAGRAVAAYAVLGDAAARVRSLCFIAEACAFQAKTAEAREAIEAALALSAQGSGNVLVQRTLAAASLARYLAGDYADAEEFAGRALRMCREIGDREGEANALTRLGNIDTRHFRIEAAAEKYSAATNLYEALGKRAGQAIVAFNAGLLFLRIGRYDDALQNFGRAHAIFVVSKDRRGVTVCAINLGMVSYLKGRYGAARRFSNQGLRLARALQIPHLECVALGNLGAAERELGEFASAVSHSERSLELRRGIAPMDLASDLGDMGLTYLRAGQLARAVSIADEIYDLEDSALDSVMFPQNVLWIAAQIYQAAALPERRAEMSARAVAMLERRAMAIPAGKWRDGYGEISFNREIRHSA